MPDLQGMCVGPTCADQERSPDPQRQHPGRLCGSDNYPLNPSSSRALYSLILYPQGHIVKFIRLDSSDGVDGVFPAGRGNQADGKGFLQEDLRSLDQGLPVEAADHDLAMQQVVDGHQAHPLVMGHKA